MGTDPAYNINVTGDIKQMLQELGTEKGRQTALHGGGGNKAQSERAALAAILASRSRTKDDSKFDTNGEVKPSQSYSIVDAASASVHGRSAMAAKAAPSDMSAARIAMQMAGEQAPVNAKLVKSRFTTGSASHSFTSTSYDPVTKNEFEYIKIEKNPKKKGYIQLHTTHGDLNIELMDRNLSRNCQSRPRFCGFDLDRDETTCQELKSQFSVENIGFEVETTEIMTQTGLKPSTLGFCLYT